MFLFKNATRMPSTPPILTTCFDVVFALQIFYLQILLPDLDARKLLSRFYCFVAKLVVDSQEKRQ
jgi:hypothetical protein